MDLGDGKYYPTIERLLTHTSGYKSYYFDGAFITNAFAHIDNDFYGITRQSLLNSVKKINLQNKDYAFSYSNFGISVVGLVLEKIYDDSFTNLMNAFIRNDLGLEQTQVAKAKDDSLFWKWKTNDGYLPAGGIISNISDMLGYLKIYLKGGLAYSANTYQKLKTINATTWESDSFSIRIDSIGMTWILDEKNNIVWHNGATTNFNSYMGFTQDGTKGVVVLSNLNANDKISMTVVGSAILAEMMGSAD